MKQLTHHLCLACLACFASACSVAAKAPDAEPCQILGTRGTHIVDEAGEPVVLKGCNVGNWLLLEMWMLCVDHEQFPDDYEFQANLAKRIGEAEKDRLMEVYRENWITPRDFEMIRSFGFNVIRLPINYRLLEDDDKPFELRPDAFKWLDRAIEMAEEGEVLGSLVATCRDRSALGAGSAIARLDTIRHSKFACGVRSQIGF